MSLSHHPNIVRNGLVAYFDAANPKSYPAGQDPYVNNVSLMLSMDGANGSTTFTDLSQNALAVTAVGNAQISTTQSKYGGSSAYFDGSGDYLTTPANSIVLGSGDWTIEFWLYLNNSGASNLIDQRSSPTQLAPSIYYNGSSIIYYTLGLDRIIGSSLQLNQWHHIAVVKASSQTKMYLNGTQTGSTYSDSNNYIGPNFTIGAYQPLGNTPPNGYIDDLRITKGISRYNASFTPPTAPLSLPGRITDLTTNKVIGTLTNGPTYSGGSLVFDGTNDYITSPTSTLFNFATGDFTIEMWVYPTSVKTFSLLDFRINETNPNGNAFVIGTSASNLWVVYQNGNQITGPTVVANQWTQVVVNRVGTAVKMFLNGVQIGSTWTTSNSFTDGAFVLGTDYPLNARFFQGRLSSVKIYKGKGLSNNEILQNYNALKGRFIL